MTAPQLTKAPSDGSASTADQIENAHGAPEQRIATEAGSSSAAQESPRKRKAAGITMGQKQALIDNLQLEITERARKLRAQYNLQAQGLRTRIEIRVNRIPMALRKSKMGELADKHKNGQHPELSKPTPSALSSSVSRPPPVPAKDTPGTRPISQAASQSTAPPKRGPGRPPKRTSDQISGAGKENEAEPAELDQPKKRTRKQPPPPAESAKASRVLSPASSNVRTLPRTTPGGKPLMSRPGLATVAGPSSPTKSPTKQQSSSNLFSNLAEKARSTRTAATERKQAASTSTTASSTGGSVRGRKPAAGATTSEATSKTARRVSGISESSESSTSTVVKKGTGKAAQAATATKRSVMGTIRRGVAGTGSKKAAAAKSTKTPASTATGRVLRNRS